MAKVVGIGGVFFKAENPESLANWYSDALGFAIDPSFGGTAFLAKELPEDAYLIWSPFKSSTKYFEPSENPYLINLMVDDLAAALKQVEAAGGKLVGDPEDGDFGAFGWFVDPEGNKVELWQPK